jgi:2-dehydropantoate 2-reductase
VRLRERGLVVTGRTSRRFYHAEPERVTQDDFKDFDVIIPRRLGVIEGQDGKRGRNPRVSRLTKAPNAPESRQNKPVQASQNVSGRKQSSSLEHTNGEQRQDPSTTSHTTLGESGEGVTAAHENQSVYAASNSDKASHEAVHENGQIRLNEASDVDGAQQHASQLNEPRQNVYHDDTPLSSFSDDSRMSAGANTGSDSSAAVPSSDTAAERFSDETRAVQDSVTGETAPEPQDIVKDALDEETATPAEADREVFDTPKDDHTHEEDLWPNADEKATLETSAKTDQSLSPFQPLAMEMEAAKDEIHILGTGVVGKFVAHSLAGLSKPPKITLLMQTPLSMQAWYDEGESITLFKQGRLHTHRGFHVESAAVQERTHPKQWAATFGKNTPVETPMTAISTLIVTTPAKVTVPAILAVRERLRSTSTICLIHDGLGVVEDLNAIVFPDASRRPTYILGNLTGSTNLFARSERRYMVEQKGEVTLTCSKQPQRAVTTTENDITISRTDHSWKESASFLVGCLTRMPELHTVPIAHKSYLQKQLLSVLAHAVIGPISVLYDCTYLELLKSHHARRTMRQLIEELLTVVYAFPEMQSLKNIDKKLSPQHLETMIRRVLRNKPDGISTMLQNIRVGRRTDIDYYNGYLLLRAAELGVECPRNEMLISVVKGKQSIVSHQKASIIPLVEE